MQLNMEHVKKSDESSNNRKEKNTIQVTGFLPLNCVIDFYT